MTATTNPIELTQTLLQQAIRAEFAQRGLSDHILRNFKVAVTQQEGKLRLNFPSNFMTLKLNAADERAFMKVFNEWARALHPVSGTSFAIKATLSSSGLDQVECTAFTAFDLATGVTDALSAENQIDMSLLGRGK